jgi:hypothetical protein
LDCASMQKRRVGVTAWSRRIESNQATGSIQVATEIAAPLELRTPTGTAGHGPAHESADGSRAITAQESTGGKPSGQQASRAMRRREQAVHRRAGTGTKVRHGARDARMRRCLILRQGASPLRPPAPFPSSFQVAEGRKIVKGSQAAQKARALDNFPPFRRFLREAGKGALCGSGPPTASRWSAPGERNCARKKLRI